MAVPLFCKVTVVCSLAFTVIWAVSNLLSVATAVMLPAAVIVPADVTTMAVRTVNSTARVRRGMAYAPHAWAISLGRTISLGGVDAMVCWPPCHGRAAVTYARPAAAEPMS